jgi:hypothetical protein
MLVLILLRFCGIVITSKKGDAKTVEKKMLIKEIVRMLKEREDTEMLHFIYMLLLKGKNKSFERIQ